MARVAVVRQEGANDASKTFIEVGYDFDITDLTSASDSHIVADILTKALADVAVDSADAYSGFEIIGGGFHDLTATHKPGDKITFQVLVGTTVVGQNEKDRPLPFGGESVEVKLQGDQKTLVRQMNIGAGNQDLSIKVTVNRGAGAASPANDFKLGYWLKLRLLKI